MASTDQSLQIAIAAYLRTLQSSLTDEADQESLGVAVQCLQDALKLPDLDGPEAKALPSLLSVWSSSPAVAEAAAAAAATASAAAPPGGPGGAPSMEKFLAMLKERGFFAGAAEGSKEYEERLATAKGRFEAKYGAGAGAGGAGEPAAAAASGPVSAERKKQAEEFKIQGNQLLAQGKHSEAVEKYTEAIKANPNEHVYYANRAAALLNIQGYEEAVKDCEAAVRLDVTYGKAHYRLGQAYYHLGRYDDAIKAYENIRKHSKDTSLYASADQAIEQARTAKQRASTGFPFGGGMGGSPASAMPDLSAALGGLDFNALLSNPAMQQMMAGMAQQFMGGAGGAGAGSAAGPGNPALQNFLNSPAIAALRGDPDLGPVIEDIEKNGQQAAFKYLNNPTVMTKLGGMLSSLLGGAGGAR